MGEPPCGSKHGGGEPRERLEHSEAAPAAIGESLELERVGGGVRVPWGTLNLTLLLFESRLGAETPAT